MSLFDNRVKRDNETADTVRMIRALANFIKVIALIMGILCALFWFGCMVSVLSSYYTAAIVKLVAFVVCIAAGAGTVILFNFLGRAIAAVIRGFAYNVENIKYVADCKHDENITASAGNTQTQQTYQQSYQQYQYQYQPEAQYQYQYQYQPQPQEQNKTDSQS